MESMSVLWEGRQDNVHSIYAPYSIPFLGITTGGDNGSLCTVLSIGEVSLLVAPLLWIPRPVSHSFGTDNHGSSEHTPGLSS